MGWNGEKEDKRAGVVWNETTGVLLTQGHGQNGKEDAQWERAHNVDRTSAKNIHK
jgi:hypothetical protein